MVEVVEDGQHQRQQIERQQYEQIKSKNEKKKRHGARNQNRHKEFVKWLMQTFSSELKSSSTTSQEQGPYHVLDVAGGKGETAARLCMCHNQRVVMVDPRPADVVDCFLKQVLPKIPNKWQKRLQQRQEQYQQEQELGREQQPGQEQEQNQSSSSPSLSKSDCVVTDLVGKRFRQIVSTLDDTTIESCEELGDAVKKSSLIIGLHADGATEAIVDAALCYQKPFVVVPCCVFPNFFRHRFVTVDDGNSTVDSDTSMSITSASKPAASATATATTTKRRTTKQKRQIPVRTHEQFCQFLLQKDSRFKMEQLPFEGRNIAIYWDGK